MSRRKKPSMKVKKKALTKRQDSAMKRHSKHHTAKHMARDFGEDGKKIVNEMKETGDYDMLIQTFLFYFGDYVNLVNSCGERQNERYIHG